MGHWFSEKERGLTFSAWNTSHNFGGGVAGFIAGWATHAFGGWAIRFLCPRGPGACPDRSTYSTVWSTLPNPWGLPPVEEYRDDLTDEETPDRHS